MPPSPLLSRRMTYATYFTEMTMTRTQNTSERTPSTLGTVGVTEFFPRKDARNAYIGLVPISPNTTPSAPRESRRTPGWLPCPALLPSRIATGSRGTTGAFLTSLWERRLRLAFPRDDIWSFLVLFLDFKGVSGAHRSQQSERRFERLLFRSEPSGLFLTRPSLRFLSCRSPIPSYLTLSLRIAMRYLRALLLLMFAPALLLSQARDILPTENLVVEGIPAIPAALADSVQ